MSTMHSLFLALFFLLSLCLFVDTPSLLSIHPLHPSLSTSLLHSLPPHPYPLFNNPSFASLSLSFSRIQFQYQISLAPIKKKQAKQKIPPPFQRGGMEME
ncbi:hypothetical protein BKA57DRAFT_150401 [Linnemannia elongata]|nr:hypothetical protein BKA57DRAFT_150401 [Linnemannia elongata]